MFFIITALTLANDMMACQIRSRRIPASSLSLALLYPTPKDYNKQKERAHYLKKHFSSALWQPGNEPDE
jgi:hypothetical protein